MYFDQLKKRIGGAQINYHFNFSLKNKYLYVQTSKCACTFLKASLSRVELSSEEFFSPKYRYTRPRVVLEDALKGSPHKPVNRSVFVKPYQLGRELFDELVGRPDYFKFAVVRNPFVRVLSAYLDTVQGQRTPFVSIKNDIALEKGVDVNSLNAADVKFVDFLRGLRRQVNTVGWGGVDQHYRLQSFHISDDIVSYSKIYKIEELTSAIDDLSVMLGRKLPDVKRDGHATGASAKIAAFFDGPECRDIVESLYRTDFERFNYDFPVAHSQSQV